VSWSAAIEESSVCVIDDLCKHEGFVVLARSKRSIRGLVANRQLGRLGDGVVVGTPHEHDTIANRGVDGKGYITKNTLRRCNNDCMGNTATRAAHAVSRGRHI